MVSGAGLRGVSVGQQDPRLQGFGEFHGGYIGFAKVITRKIPRCRSRRGGQAGAGELADFKRVYLDVDSATESKKGALIEQGRTKSMVRKSTLSGGTSYDLEVHIPDVQHSAGEEGWQRDAGEGGR